jgi:hypothetical protein
MPPPRRKGFPLSVKLTLTTAVLVATAVAASGLASLRTLNDLAGKNAAARRAAGQAAIQRQAELMARSDANAAALPLAEGNFTYLDTLVAETVKEDPHILWMLHRDGEMSVLALRGSPLGAPTDDMVIRTGQRDLRLGDTFVFFTDGLIDRADPTGARFGDRRLRRFLRAGPARDVPGLMRDMLGTVDAFSRGTPADDDVTLVLCEFDPRPAESMPQQAVG